MRALSIADFFPFAYGLIPLVPCTAAVGFLDGHEQGVVVEPGGIVGAEGLEFQNEEHFVYAIGSAQCGEKNGKMLFAEDSASMG